MILLFFLSDLKIVILMMIHHYCRGIEVKLLALSHLLCILVTSDDNDTVLPSTS